MTIAMRDTQHSDISERRVDAHAQVGSSRGQRSKNGCATCRIRRIKCDETQPRCLKCCSRDYECIWSGVPASSLPSAASLGLVSRAPKTTAACIECRRSKTRCSGPSSDHHPCNRCTQRSLPCHWSHEPVSLRDKRHSSLRSPTHDGQQAKCVREDSHQDNPHGVHTSTPHPVHPDPDLLASALTSRVELIAIVRTYFSTVHQHGYLSFLHEPTIMHLIDQNRAPRQLLWLIVANSMRYARNESSSVAWSRGDELAFSAFRSLESQVHDNVGALHLMAVILAHHHEYGRGRFSSSWILAGNAVRIMQLLRLHISLPLRPSNPAPTSHGLLSPEALRRLAWAVFYMDTMNDCGTYGLHTLSEDVMRIQLPCDEATFLRGDEIETEPLHPDQVHSAGHEEALSRHQYPVTRVGVSAYIMRAAAMRRRILHFGSKLHYTTDDESAIDREADLLSGELQLVLSNLPTALAYSRTNLFVLKDQNTAFILLHMLRQNCVLMLLQAKMVICERFSGRRILLPSLWQRRIDTSLSIADIVGDALKDGVHCDTYVGVQAYGALEILIFDPLRLVAVGQPAGSGAERYRSPINTLMQLIREQSQHHATLFNLRLEASHRLIRSGLEDVLSEDDQLAYRCGYTAKDPGGEEYDFRAMDWYLDESRVDQDAGMETDDLVPSVHGASPGASQCQQCETTARASGEEDTPGNTSTTISFTPGQTRYSTTDLALPNFGADTTFAPFGDAVFPLWTQTNAI